jgi:hypothetical protein
MQVDHSFDNAFAAAGPAALLAGFIHPGSPAPGGETVSAYSKLSVLPARLRSTRRDGGGSEAVALRHPVMPVANGLVSGLVGINSHQL